MTGVTDEEWDEEFGDEETDSVHDLKGKERIFRRFYGFF